jgi:hypothetical protein
VASENAEEPEYDDSTSKDTKTDGDTTDANANRVMTVDVEGLCGPEHDDREEVGTGDEGDDQSQGQDARFLLKTRGEHGIFGTLYFPDGEGDAECSSEEEGDKNVGRSPFVLFRKISNARVGERTESAGTNLISSPLQSTEEQDHCNNTQKAAHKVNLRNDLPPREASGVGARGWEVKEQGAKEPHSVPCTHERTAVSPAGV